jgi:hypothetical protein
VVSRPGIGSVGDENREQARRFSGARVRTDLVMEKDNKINILADEASGARSLEACGRRRADAEDRIELRCRSLDDQSARDTADRRDDLSDRASIAPRAPQQSLVEAQPRMPPGWNALHKSRSALNRSLR